MTKTLKLTSLLFAAMLIFGTSCGKYPDGPGFSLRTKKARLVNTWKVTYATDANDDITENTAGVTLTIDEEGNWKTGCETTNGAVQEETGTWQLSNDKDILILTHDDATITIPQQWKINRLKNDELWLENAQANGASAERKFEGQD